MDSLYHFVAGLVVAVVLAYTLKNIAKVSSAPRFIWSTYLVCFLLYFREVTQFQTKNFESHILKGWNPWSTDFPWSQNKQLETFLPIAMMLIVAYAVSWYYKKRR